MNLSDYYFDLPSKNIAKYPPESRDGGRLMVVPKCWEKDVQENHSSMIVDLPNILPQYEEVYQYLVSKIKK